MTFRINNKQTEVARMYEWQEAELEKQPLSRLCIVETRLEKRRQQLMAKLPFDGDIDKTSTVVEQKTIDEWLVLLSERDRVAKLKINQANREEFSACTFQLHGVLNQVKQFDDRCMPDAFKQAVRNLSAETSKYLSTVPLQHNCPSELPKLLTDFDIETELTDHPNDSNIKPFTPLRLPNFSKLAQTPKGSPRDADGRWRKSTRKVMKRSTPKSGGASSSSSPKLASRTPRAVNTLHVQKMDLRMSLLKSKENLRQTPGMKRSPGGSPLKKKRVLDMRDQSDLVTYALRKKFQNVRKLYSRPSTAADADTSFNISIDC